MVNFMPWCFTPEEIILVHIEEEAVWAPELVWMLLQIEEFKHTSQ
jgi:hypothetical protein